MPLLFFIIIPVCELWLLFTVGAAIGFLPTLLLIFTTAFIGLNLIRRQGLQTYGRIIEQSGRGEIPNGPLFDGACILIAGAFLLTPGFITDTAGFLLLTPVIRRFLGRFILDRIPFSAAVYQATSQQKTQHDDGVIDVDYEDLSDRD